MDTIAIIGAGEAAVRAAVTLREEGYAGGIVMFDGDPELPYERPALSKPEGAAHAALAGKPIEAAGRYEALGIELCRGLTVTETDRPNRWLRLSDGSRRGYDRLLLATGATPRRLPMESGVGIHVLRTLADARSLYAAAGPGKRVIIVGAGLIGLEIAAQLRTMDCSVTVLEVAPVALGRAVPQPCAQVLVDRHRAEGVEFRFEARIGSIACNGVVLADGSVLEADLVVVAVGAVPDTGLARAIDLSVATGILTNMRQRTADPNIFAAGDCAELRTDCEGATIRRESWRSARDQGARAARAMLGRDPGPLPLNWFWTDQYDLGLQVIGAMSGGAETVERPFPDGRLLFHMAGDGRLLGAAGLGPGTSAARDIKIAEKLIEKGWRGDAATLADAGVAMKSLLKAA